MRMLDIGCGNAKRVRDGYEYYGCDIVKSEVVDDAHFGRADLILDPLPFDSDMFELVTAYDFLEHLPLVFYEGRKRTIPLINVFNEVYRVLKHGGIFYFFVPCLPSEAVYQDPTHLNVWVQEKVNYFCGDYYGFHGHYGHTSRFEKVSVNFNVHHLTVELRAIKNLPEDAPYLLKY